VLRVASSMGCGQMSFKAEFTEWTESKFESANYADFHRLRAVGQARMILRCGMRCKRG